MNCLTSQLGRAEHTRSGRGSASVRFEDPDSRSRAIADHLSALEIPPSSGFVPRSQDQPRSGKNVNFSSVSPCLKEIHSRVRSPEDPLPCPALSRESQTKSFKNPPARSGRPTLTTFAAAATQNLDDPRDYRCSDQIVAFSKWEFSRAKVRAPFVPAQFCALA
jgi:hypothetical protein